MRGCSPARDGREPCCKRGNRNRRGRPRHNPDRYVGLSDEATDVRQRVKVFIAPKFYFRSMYGGYTDMKYFDGEDAGRDPNAIVGGLANAVQDDRWKDWLFVFGTSVVVAGPFIPPETGNPKLSCRIAVLNTSLVQQGYYSDENERTLKGVAVVKD